MAFAFMTYEEIYRAIEKDMPDVFAHYHKVIKSKVDRRLKTAIRFPQRISINWTHPKSRNTCSYFIQSNRRSQWDNPFMSVCYEHEVKKGRELLIVVPTTYKKGLLLNVFTSHFYEQYGKRFLNGKTDIRSIVAQYLIRNTAAAALGPECVSLKEQQEAVPGFTKESMLTLDGIGLGLRSFDGNIVVYRTFVSFDQLFEKQYEKVWPNYLYFVCLLVQADSPRHIAHINEIYETWASKMHQLADDTTMSEDDKRTLIYDEFKETYQKLIQHKV